MRGLNLSKFKKMKETKDWATLIHEDGHQLNIAKAPLSPIQRKQLEKLETHEQHFYDAGVVEPQPSDPPIADNAPVSSVPEGDAPPPAALPVARSFNELVQGSPPPPAAIGPDKSAPTPALGSQIPGLQQEQQAQKEIAKAIGKEGEAKAQAETAASQAQASLLQTHQDVVNALNQRDDALYQAAASNEIDPKHYWQDHSKIAAGIGVLLSGLGQVIGGPNVKNGAIEAIENGINRDIDAQKANQGKNLSLYQMNLRAYGDQTAATLATASQLNTLAKFQIDKAASQAQGPLAKANAKLASAKLAQTIGAYNYKLGLLNPTSDNPDPASRIQFLVPGERQKDVVGEINAAKSTRANAPGIIDAFIQAAEDSRPLTGGINTSPASVIPGMKTAGQQALQARLGPTFQNVEGTVRQSAMDNLDHNVTPRFGDSDDHVGTKLRSLVDYITSKNAATSASKSFGIDLSKYPSTNTQGIEGYIEAKYPQYYALLKNASGGESTPMYQKRIINGKAYRVPIKAQ